MSYEDEFKARVLAWLQTRVPDATTIVSVEGHGSDWGGSTEDGWHSYFDAYVGYAKADGIFHSYDVVGEEMGELWKVVVR